MYNSRLGEEELSHYNLVRQVVFKYKLQIFGARAASLSWAKGAGAELAALPRALVQEWRGNPRPPHTQLPGPW